METDTQSDGSVVFFFQAEDGIRDGRVTGVQTCALPIYPGVPAPPLTVDADADVVILGGGYTGLWTAWFLIEAAPGIDVILLEADICGGGPSGRNGGFLDGWWGQVADMVATFGEEDSVAMLKAAESSPAQIGEWCERNAVDAWFRHDGDLAVTTNEKQEGRWATTIDAAARLGAADRFEILSPEQVHARCDSPRFGGGMFLADAATIQPARLARGLRRVLLERGVRIFESTPVTRFASG